MKRFIIIISAILAIICFTGCPAEVSDDIEVTESEWLFALYMDADNNINDDLWADVANEQLALATMMKDENTMLNGFPSIKIVMLWDGQAAADAREETPRPNTRVHPRSEIYELGPADQATVDKVLSEENPDPSWLMSNFSKRLTDEADWLEKEPDMGDVNTLKNFLSWVNERYSAKYKVLLLSDHGAGTESETSSGGFGARSLCGDDTNNSGKLLTATDVKKAISSSDFRPNIIYMDCCLQGNVETTYILRGTADYLVTSANLSFPNNHFSMLRSLRTNSTPKDFAKAIVTSYGSYHIHNNMQAASDGMHTSFERTLTQAVYNLNTSKQNALFEAIENLSSKLYAEVDDVKDAIYTSYVYQDLSNTANCNGMAYPGSYFILNDIGYFCKNISEDPNNVGISASSKTAANKVIDALDDIIICSWMGKRTTDSTEHYYAKNLPQFSYIPEETLGDSEPILVYTENDVTDGQFGLTIVTQAYNEGWIPFFEYYKEETGYSSKWENLLKYWYDL